jgi:SAM-dependent methyltransferase
MMPSVRRLLEAPRKVVLALRALRQVPRSVNEALGKLQNLETRLNTLHTDLKSEISAELSFTFYDLRQESKNLLTHLTTSLHTRLNTFENVLLPALAEQVHGAIAMNLELRTRIESNRSSWTKDPGEHYKPAKADPIESYLALAEKGYPRIYGLWRSRLDAVLEALRETKVGNAAHAGDLYSRMFRSFVELHASGRVLDVGCGIFGRPYYLAGYPAELISGIDPLPPGEPCDFEFVRGLSEYLPWPDDSFSTVISATSLDHCLSLDKSLAEMRRVVRPGGKLLLWIGSSPGSPKYDPDAPNFAPADQFHLFHFDVAWFDPIIEKTFTMIDRIQLQRTGYSHVMYCLETKQTQPPIKQPQAMAMAL